MDWTMDVEQDWVNASEGRRVSILEEITGIDPSWLMSDARIMEMVRDGVDLAVCVNYVESRFPW